MSYAGLASAFAGFQPNVIYRRCSPDVFYIFAGFCLFKISATHAPSREVISTSWPSLTLTTEGLLLARHTRPLKQPVHDQLEASDTLYINCSKSDMRPEKRRLCKPNSQMLFPIIPTFTGSQTDLTHDSNTDIFYDRL